MKKLLIVSLIFVLLLSGCQTSDPPADNPQGTMIINEYDEASTPTEPPTQPDAATVVESARGFSSIRLSLPADWEYQEFLDDCRCADSERCFGITFHPAGEEEAVFTLKCSAIPVGICGTGVTFEDVTFSGGLSATKCTENDWTLFIFQNPAGNFTLEYSLDAAQRAMYGDTIGWILENLELSPDQLRSEQILELAKGAVPGLEPIVANFDYHYGTWRVGFGSKKDAVTEEHIFDAQGNRICD